ncbi:membrane lipoprotein lipid attachment site-containing protein [Bacillus infantis]|uniref:membrane lipoprotein lipid attachment site-containing protein n=1 Tax=Bacillus infantis TaxID=324767 RepID=UPI003CF781C4
MKKIVLFFFALMFLAACSKEVNTFDYRFAGESEHWEAEYVFKGTEEWGEKNGRRTYSNENSDEFFLEYKGPLEELSSLKNLEYSYETSAGSGGGTREFDAPRQKRFLKAAYLQRIPAQ